MKGAAARRAAYRFGLAAEGMAVLLLTLKGYRVLARRFRTPVGEIDLVVRRGESLVFVEVKARPDLDAAAQALGLRQRTRILRASQAWLAHHPAHARLRLRFDVVLLAPRALPRHIEHAFAAD
jgi:putative endonuclease